MPLIRAISNGTAVEPNENLVYVGTTENYYTGSILNGLITENSAVYRNSTEDYINKIVEKILRARLEEEVEKCIKKIYRKKKIDNE